MSLPQLVLATLAALLMIAGAVSDLRSFRIPNPVVLAVALAALANCFAAGGLQALGWKAALAALIIGGIFWKIGLMGAGDVKFAVAALLWLPGQVSDFMVLTSVLGLVLALFFVIRGKIRKKMTSKIPYVPPIAASAIALLAMRAFPL